jgi:hypothetical protein
MVQLPCGCFWGCCFWFWWSFALVANVNALKQRQEKRIADFPTTSGIKTWIDPFTPQAKQEYFSSRGNKWELVMSDELNNPTRNFRPGKDHLWTSLEKPDGVNAALQIYSHNMSSIECDQTDDDNVCYLQIKVMDEVNVVQVFNMYQNPPGFQNSTFVRTVVPFLIPRSVGSLIDELVYCYCY